MKYPNVKNAHIVPRTYLENFAADGRIGVYQVREHRRLVRPVRDVGTRSRFYRRQRPDGTFIDDVEWSLGHSEAGVTPILRSFDEHWPLADDAKVALGEFLAYPVAAWAPMEGRASRAEPQHHGRVPEGRPPEDR